MDMFTSLPPESVIDAPETETSTKRLKQEDNFEEQSEVASDLLETPSEDQENVLHKDQVDSYEQAEKSLSGEPRSIYDVLKELGQEAKDLHSTWTRTFSDGERFEKFCPSRLDRLIEQAIQREQSLIKQKQELSKRLRGISKVLDM